MSVRDEFRKVAGDLRADLKDGEEHLGWLLDEVERHLGLASERAAVPAPAPQLEAAPDAESEPVAGDEVDLSTLTVAELRAYAGENSIDLGDAKKKAEILAVIEAAPNDGAEADEPQAEEESEGGEEPSGEES